MACNSTTKESGPAVARVGSDLITVQEFKLNYEFGFSNLKHGQNNKRTYLDFMINEKLLALEGKKRGLHKSPEIEKMRNQLLGELQIEALLEKEVRNKIMVTEAEIRQEIIESAVSFKFRYYLADHQDEALNAANLAREDGFSAITDLQNPPGSESLLPSKIQTSGYVTRNDIPEAVFQNIKDLPIGNVSGPVELDGKYAVMQMLDIRRKAILEEDFKSRSATVEQQIFYRKYEIAVAQYLDKLLTPKNIKTSGKMFGMLCKAVMEWKNDRKQISLAEAVKSENENKPGLNFLKDNGEQIFVTFENGSLSANQLINELNFKYLPEKNLVEHDIIKAMNEVIQLSLRDYFLRAEAARQKIQLPSRLNEELVKWTEKWTYQAMLRNDAVAGSVSNTELQKWYRDHEHIYQANRPDTVHLEDVKYLAERDYLRNKMHFLTDSLLDVLSKKYVVEVFSEVLDTVEVSSSKKSKWMTLQAYKTYTGRLAWPSVDPLWAEFIGAGVLTDAY